MVRFGQQAGDRRPLQEARSHAGIEEDLHRLEHGGVEQPCPGQRPLIRLDDELGSIDLHLACAHRRQQHTGEPLLCDHRQMPIDLDGVDGVDHPVGEVPAGEELEQVAHERDSRIRHPTCVRRRAS